MKRERGVGRRTWHGIAWTLAGAALSNGVRLGSVALLGRLLAPADFGVVAAAMTVLFFARTIKDVGVGLALVQRKEIAPGHVEAAFGFSLLLGLGLAGLMALGAPLIASFYGMDHAVPLVRVLSILFALRGLSSTSTFLLQRELRFRPLALIDVGGYAIGTAVCVALAWRGHGPWALAIGYLVEATVQTALLVAIRPPPRRLRMQRQALRDLMGFGGGHTLSRIANYVATQGDYVVVGRALGAGELGFYTRAYELVRFPATVFNQVVGVVLFASFAKIQHDRARLGNNYRRALFGNALVLLPASAVLALLAPEVIHVLIGPAWAGAVLPFQIMCASMLFRTSYKLGGILGRSGGEVFKIAGMQVVYAVFVVGGAALSVRWGIVGVSITTSIAVALHFVNLTRIGIAASDLSWRAVLAAHGPGTLLAGLALVVAWPIALGLRGGGTAPWAILLTAGGAAAAVTTGALALAMWRLAGDWAWLQDSLRGARRGRRPKRPQGEAPAAPPPALD